jgi:hypothetical protein
MEANRNSSALFGPPFDLTIAIARLVSHKASPARKMLASKPSKVYKGATVSAIKFSPINFLFFLNQSGKFIHSPLNIRNQSVVAFAAPLTKELPLSIL